MSTLKVSAINNAAAPSGGLVFSAAGLVSGAGMDLIVATTFSASSAVSFDNCFTSTYSNYRIMLELTAMSGTDVPINMRLRVAAADSSASFYTVMRLYQQTSVIGSTQVTNGTHWALSLSDVTFPTWVNGRWDVFAPQKAKITTAQGHGQYVTSAGTIYQEFQTAAMNTTVQYDGFTFYPSSGTFAGTIRVYGIRD